MSEPSPLIARPAPAWHPDPTGRFVLRWWDGQAWSDYVYGPDGYSHAPVLAVARVPERGGAVGQSVGILAASALPTAFSGFLLWFAVTIALSNPVEGLATLSSWFVSVLFSIAASVLSIVAIAMTMDGQVTRRARRTVLGLGLGVIAVNAAIVVVPIFIVLVGGAVE